MRAAIYTRFSSDRQSELSTQAQVRACKEYAEANGISVYRIYSDEAISGLEEKTESRVQYKTMLADAKNRLFDVLLIHKYDRVARSLEEHVKLSAMLKKEGVLLIAVAQNFGDGIEGDFAKQMMWVLSEYYSKNLSKEVKKGHREVALQGLHNGGWAPFGYDIVDQHYIINEFEAVYVKKMFDAALNGKGYTALIEEMKQAGVRGKRGKEIQKTQIHEILHNEKYTGTYVYSLEEEQKRIDRRTKPHAIRVENAIPAIIDKTTFEEVQRIMNSRRHCGRRTDYLCSGLVYCSCGAKMHVFVSSNKGHTYRYYRCSNKCGTPSIKLEDMDHVATEYLKELLSEENRKKVALCLRNYKNHKKDCQSSYKSAIKKRIAEKQAEYDALMKNLTSAALPTEILSDLGQRMQTIKDEIHVLENTEPPEDYSVDTIFEWLSSIQSAPDEKAIQLLIERIDVSFEENKTDFRITSTLKSVLCRKMAKVVNKNTNSPPIGLGGEFLF